MKDNKEMKMNIAVFGGSFDPIHSAHADIIKELSETFDKVIVMPSNVSPFKPLGATAAAKHRKTMLSNAVDGLQNVTVSDFELKNENISYTADTMEHLMTQYKNAALYFVIGTDLLDGLHKWYRFTELKKRVIFYVVKRENFEADKKVLAALKKKGAVIEMSDLSMRDISSSLARVSVAFNNSALIGDKNFEYIKKHKLYTEYNYIVNAYESFELKPERRAHTFRTVEAGIALAKRFKADVEKVITAILLHDIGKYATEEVLLRNGLELTTKLKSFPLEIAHSYISAYIAKNYFNITDKSIIKSVEAHTTGALVMDKLAKIVFLADYIECDRNFESLDTVRAACGQTLDGGMEAALKNTIEYLEGRGREVYHPTKAVYEKFVLINQKAREKAEKKTGKTSGTAFDSNAKKIQSVKLNTQNPTALADTIASLVNSKKGRDTVIIDIADKTIIADYFVVSSVASTTAVKAITEYVDEILSKNCELEPLRRDIDSKWAAIDYGSVILHIQTEETRSFYDLQRLWSDGTNTKYIKD